MIVVVVVFPSLPVTAMVLQGQTWKKTSISEVIVVQPVQIVRAQAQLGPQTLQLLRLAAEVLPLPLVAGGHLNIRPQQHFDERCVGHADAQHRHPFAPQGRQILLYGGTHGSFLPFCFVYN